MITGLSRAGLGKLLPIPSDDIEFDVEYRIELGFPNGLDRNAPPSAEEVSVRVSLKPWFDESYLPEGMYQLQWGKGTWRIQKRNGAWELMKESVEDIIATKVRVISPS
jgi:hypothetical protein